MTERERAILRDKIARARLKLDDEPGRIGWHGSPEDALLNAVIWFKLSHAQNPAGRMIRERQKKNRRLAETRAARGRGSAEGRGSSFVPADSSVGVIVAPRP